MSLPQFVIYDAKNRTRFIFTYWAGSFNGAEKKEPYVSIAVYHMPTDERETPYPGLYLPADTLPHFLEAVEKGVESQWLRVAKPNGDLIHPLVEMLTWFDEKKQAYLTFEAAINLGFNELRLHIHTPLKSLEVSKLHLSLPDSEIFLAELRKILPEKETVSDD